MNMNQLIAIVIWIISLFSTSVQDKNQQLHCVQKSLSGVCKACERGWYGVHCYTVYKSPCPVYAKRVKEAGTVSTVTTRGNCVIDGCDKQFGRCVQCDSGYYKENCLVECPSHCGKSYDDKIYCNRSTGNCMEICEAGFWGDMCTKVCHDNCANETCSFKHGYCDGCISGSAGARCEINCSKGCMNDLCYQWNENCVNGCKHEYYGAKCSMVCSEACLEKVCHQSSGQCFNGCVPGYYGANCNMTCSQNCQETVCFFNTSSQIEECLQGCIAGKMSASCAQDCPENCTSCNQTTGECLTCKEGFWGQTCSSHCSVQCFNQTCDIEGNCHSCIRGTHGARCDQACSDGCSNLDKGTLRDDTSTNPDDSSLPIIITVIVFIMVVIVFIMVMIVICIPKWRRKYAQISGDSESSQDDKG